jgi:hypothetical protein
MKPDKPVDIFMLHVHLLGMSVKDAIHHLNAEMAFVSHVLGLGHGRPISPVRWSYDYAFETIEEIKESKATVLSWGERWLLPGTVLEEEVKGE